MILLNEKQTAFFKVLRDIKDINAEIFSGYLYKGTKMEATILKKEYEHLQNKLDTNEDIEAFKKIQDELIETTLYRVMELIDGYSSLNFKLDLVDRKDKSSLREHIQLHDAWIDYLAA